MKKGRSVVLLLLIIGVVHAASAMAAPAFDAQLMKFTEAALAGHVEEAKAFLAQPGFVGHADSQGHTALFAAACAANLDVLETVLATRGIDVNRRDLKGGTALFYAASGGHTPAARVLLEHRAKPNLADAEGKTPLIAAVMTGQEAVVKLLLDHGAAPDVADKSGSTPLFYAAQMGSYDIAKLLVDHGAVADRPRGDGLTPIAVAKTNLHDKVSGMLREDSLRRLADATPPH